VSAPHDPTDLVARRLRRALAPDPDDQDHLTSALLDALTRGRADDVDREAAAEHLETCAQCAEDLADRRAMQAAIEAAAFRPQAGAAAAPDPAVAASVRTVVPWQSGQRLLAVAGLAAAAALAVAVATSVWPRSGGGEAPQARAATPPVVPSTPPSTTPLATLSTPAPTAAPASGSTAALMSAPTGVAAGESTLTADERALVDRVLASGRVELPPDAHLLAGTAGTLLGGAAGSSGDASAVSFGPVTPRGTALLAPRPVFTWQRLPGATAYTVRVFDERFQEVARGRVAGTAWTPSADLARGTTYSWQVTAHRAGEEVTAPAPPQPEALFRMVTADVAARAEARRARLEADPLALGILQAEAGLVADAAASFARAAGGATGGTASALALRSRATALRATLPATLPAQGAPTTTKPAQ